MNLPRTAILNLTVAALLAATAVQADTTTPDAAVPPMQHDGMMHGAPAGQTDAKPSHGTMSGDHAGMVHAGMGHAAAPAMNHGATPAPASSGAMTHDSMSMQGGSAPADARDPHAYADGYTLTSGAYALPDKQRLHLADEKRFHAVRVDRLERVFTSHGDATAYDAQAWIGRDFNRLVVKAEGHIANGRLQEATTQAFWSHALSAFWNGQLGVRHDSGIDPSRTWLAFGFEGLAPYWFETDVTAYVGGDGRTALYAATEYDLRITQRLILQPRLEANLYGRRDAARSLGSGLSDASAGLRLRREFGRQFAPYVGVEWAGKFGETADFARAAGEPARETRWVAGLHFWF
ncbi:copper resistance protein CopB [Acidihalobacter aeolianus]|uniref:Copper resistance protein CopB n=1 Tax=Acidihalobacter aeolianus TaxID=2792603 RepID=A0A1D8K778_9GAMM|nr:copper resistance protein B [Acidihalobacter aeolianus]AOV16786.1 copper resistance protein CopB [Acidihalobacter aeolianus]